MSENPLGKQTDYQQKYSADILFAIPRQSKLKCFGFDLWHAYEFSWLNQNNLPQVGILKIIVPYSSKKLVESKSLKLYLNTFAFLSFETQADVCSLIQTNLEHCVEAAVEVQILSINDKQNFIQANNQYLCIDKASHEINENLFEAVQANLLEVDTTSSKSKYYVYSNLFRSLCPVTSQPDWASIFLVYEGHEIKQQSLLRYLLSFRKHQGFHEACADLIYTDIETMCVPEKLGVYAAFTRRGGIDINPLRANDHQLVNELLKLGRQVRQ